MLNCPKCNRIIMDTTSEGGYKVRSRMLVFTSEGEAQAICPSCKASVPVPWIRLTPELPEQPTKPKFIVNS